MTTVVLMVAAFGFGYLLGKGHGPKMLKLTLAPLQLLRKK